MNKDLLLDDSLDLEWQGQFGDLTIEENSCVERLFEFRDNEITNDIRIQKMAEQQQSITQTDQKQTFSVLQQYQPFLPQKYHPSERQDRSPSEQDSSRQPKGQKQKYYAKAYRQRTKQKYKNLQDQNTYLKKRIGDLQCQLRQQELQLGRLKFTPPEKQYQTENLSKQWVEKVQVMFQPFEVNPHQFKQQYEPGHDFYKQFTAFHQQRGFAGRQRSQALNYHFNELLEVVLKDSEKFMCLSFAISKNYNQPQPLPEFQILNEAFKEIFKFNNDDLWSRLKIFGKFLHPISLELNMLVSQFYKKYQEILTCSKKIHIFLRENLLKNMGVAIKKVQLEKFFETYKYGKVMRKLRYSWFQWMKSLVEREEQQKKDAKKGSKKKKV